MYNVNINSLRLQLQFLTLHPIWPFLRLSSSSATQRESQNAWEDFWISASWAPTNSTHRGYFTPFVAGGPSCQKGAMDPLIHLI